MVELGAVTRELISMEKDLRGAMHRDHGVGLAELLSSLVMCIREEMGLRSPENLTDEDEQEEEEVEVEVEEVEGGREGGGERKKSEGSVDDVDDIEASAATVQGQQQQQQQQQQEEVQQPEHVAAALPVSSSSSSSSGKGMEYQETKDQDQQTTAQTEEGMAVCAPSTSSSSSSSSSSPTFMEYDDCIHEMDENHHQQQQQQQQQQEEAPPLLPLPPLPDQPQEEPQRPPPPSSLPPSPPLTLASRWGQSMLLLREALVALGIFLRAHSRKKGSSSSALDRAEMEHVRDAVAEMIAAYPPTALRITELVLRAWPTGQSTREMGFLQLLSVVLTVSPLLPRLEERTRAHHRAFARLARCLQSPHAGVAEEALLACSNPRVIALYVGVGAPGGGGEGLDYINGMVQVALGRSMEGHWNPEVRQEARRLKELLNVISGNGVRAAQAAHAEAAGGALEEGGGEGGEGGQELLAVGVEGGMVV
jgi:hypothetical protein